MEAQRPVLQFSVPCLGVDEQQGPPCFMYVLHELQLDGFPYRFPESAGIFIVNGWSGGQGRFQQRMRLVHPDGSEMLDTGPRDLHITEGTVMVVNFLQGIVFPTEGAYRVQISLDDQPVLEYPLHAHLAPVDDSQRQ